MKRLLLATIATCALLVALAAPAPAAITLDPGASVAKSEGKARGHDADAEDDGTDLATFAALMAGGVVVVLALAGLVRAGHRLPQ